MQKIIRFSSQFYKRKAIREAILAYAHLAKFRVKDRKNYIEVRMEGVGRDFKNIFVDEFNNYCLGATKKCA